MHDRQNVYATQKQKLIRAGILTLPEQEKLN